MSELRTIHHLSEPVIGACRIAGGGAQPAENDLFDPDVNAPVVGLGGADLPEMARDHDLAGAETPDDEGATPADESDPSGPCQADIRPDQLATVLDGWSGVTASVADVAAGPGQNEAASKKVAVARPGASAQMAGENLPVTEGMDGADVSGEAMPLDGTGLPRGSADPAPGLAAIDRAPTAVAPPDVGSGPGLTAIDDSVAAREIQVAATAMRLEAAPAAMARMAGQAAHGPAVATMRQIAEAIVNIRDDKIEIALAPEELGRVRMIVTGTEKAAHVTVWVERPEVMDLMRRNTAMLAEYFGEAGMEGASFEFREGGGDSDSPPAEPSGEGVPTADPPHPSAAMQYILASDRRIDIRL